jgi:hypothetical protein
MNNKKETVRPVKFKDDRYLNGTGRTWSAWSRALKRLGAEKKSHKDLAALLEKKYDLSPWWAQSITVRFEQEIGRRQPGETCENTFQANVSKTITGDVREIFSRWIDRFSSFTSLNGVKVANDVTISETKKWYYWRVKLSNASAVSVNFSQKEENKILLQVNHDNLLNEEEAFFWKEFWKKKLASFFSG